MITIYKPTRVPQSGSEMRWLVRRLPAVQVPFGARRDEAYVWTVTRINVYSNGYVVAGDPIPMDSLALAHRAARNACAAYYGRPR